MNISFQNSIKKITAFFTKKKGRLFSHDPLSDWKHIIFVGIIFMIIAIGVDGYLFYKINRGELFTTQNSNTMHMPSFDRQLLDQENKYYDGLEAAFTASQSASSTPAIDPSL